MIRFAENLNKMITAGLGGAMEAPSTEVAVGHRVRYMNASGAAATFETNAAARIRSLRVDMQPIQAGSGDPSPENIRPITGRDSVTVTRTGKNLLDMDNVPKSMLNCYNAQGGAQNRIGCVIELPPGTYTVTVYPRVDESAYIYMNVVSEGNQFVSFDYLAAGADANNSKTVTLTSGQKIYIFDQQANMPSDTTKFHLRYFQIELGSTATDFEPYDGQSVTVQLGQTVYGGTLDVSTGKLTVTHGEIANYNGEVLTGEWISDRDVYAAGTTPTIGAQVVYVLDTPQTIDLDPQQITTLIGGNNVWTDAGDVALEYPYYEETEGY